MVLQGTISGSRKNLSNQGSLKNHFLKEFFKEPIKMVLQGTISGSTKNLSNQGCLKNHFQKEFFKEPIKVSQRTSKKWFFKGPFSK